ncbi:MAG TPA: 2,3-epoxybenzoyl-CoA dihydrolase [Aliidongia sp.]|uniref:2,3-epoxybenzoyl-CoA dihydrolase n=1 Tax=Aliidongia sp. TaxID=1914230 RepID=UPI002DDD1563|nr:2,3-epoxybenzoyl-CoA dihydrolase [Aliidongia sp.]HEV2674794.1 2,3-epoxybenzoyl-CoA dihydrolase [Aliidongia sp.]
MITFDAVPEEYRHWTLSVDGRVATLAMDVDEDGGLKPGYKLKLNSYDLGVDIELYDALQRIRFEHPAVGCVVLTSGKERMFCSGANIYMLGLSSHAWKVNFCKFTNETRNGLEDSSAHDGLKFIAALNGTTAGGGYEVALACDEILMVDDRSSVVSLPEVPLLGVLPGTGGLTRVVDKRKVRRDLADMFCTSADGVRADRARQWGLVDAIAKPADFPALVKTRSAALAAASIRPADARGIKLHKLERMIDEAGYRYAHVDVRFDRPGRSATLTISAPTGKQPATPDAIVAAGDRWWPLALARQLDDALLLLRTNELDLGLLVLKTRGDAAAVLAADATLLAHRDHWLVRETIGYLRRTFARLDVTSRSLYAIADQDSCFAGLLYELALAADRVYMLALPEGDENPPEIQLDGLNFGLLPMVNGRSRLETRFLDDAAKIAKLEGMTGKALTAEPALALGLVTLAPDDLDWEDEIRLALEERASLSPDALTGLEASLRFAGPETVWTKVFGRLSAWQNWVFVRPNATGEHGALKVFGTGSKAQFNFERV